MQKFALLALLVGCSSPTINVTNLIVLDAGTPSESVVIQPSEPTRHADLPDASPDVNVNAPDASEPDAIASPDSATPATPDAESTSPVDAGPRPIGASDAAIEAEAGISAECRDLMACCGYVSNANQRAACAGMANSESPSHCLATLNQARAANVCPYW